MPSEFQKYMTRRAEARYFDPESAAKYARAAETDSLSDFTDRELYEFTLETDSLTRMAKASRALSEQHAEDEARFLALVDDIHQRVSWTMVAAAFAE